MSKNLLKQKVYFKIVKNSPINNKKFNFLLLNKYLDFKKSFFIIDTYKLILTYKNFI